MEQWKLETALELLRNCSEIALKLRVVPAADFNHLGGIIRGCSGDSFAILPGPSDSAADVRTFRDSTAVLNEESRRRPPKMLDFTTRLILRHDHQLVALFTTDKSKAKLDLVISYQPFNRSINQSIDAS